MLSLMADWSDEARHLAQKAVDFFETKLVHVEGALAGQPFLLQPWQESIIRRLFGTLRPDGTRQYRSAYIEIPRKNGKSTLCAGIALYLLVEDGEPGAQVYSAAVDKSQASIVFDSARAMVEASPYLRGRVLPFRGVMETVENRGRYRVLAADSKGTKPHGRTVQGAVVDELHVHPNLNVGDILRAGTGARRQPLIVTITTAGDN